MPDFKRNGIENYIQKFRFLFKREHSSAHASIVRFFCCCCFVSGYPKEVKQPLYSICIVFPWLLHNVCIVSASICKAFANRLHSIHLHSVCIAFAWHLHSVCIAFVKCLYRICRALHSICMAFALRLHSVCIAFA